MAMHLKQLRICPSAVRGRWQQLRKALHQQTRSSAAPEIVSCALQLKAGIGHSRPFDSAMPRQGVKPSAKQALS
jgi:hypothetical protein